MKGIWEGTPPPRCTSRILTPSPAGPPGYPQGARVSLLSSLSTVIKQGHTAICVKALLTSYLHENIPGESLCYGSGVAGLLHSKTRRRTLCRSHGFDSKQKRPMLQGNCKNLNQVSLGAKFQEIWKPETRVMDVLKSSQDPSANLGVPIKTNFLQLVLTSNLLLVVY